MWFSKQVGVRDLSSQVRYDDSSLAAIRHVQSIVPVVQPRPNIRSHSVLLSMKTTVVVPFLHLVKRNHVRDFPRNFARLMDIQGSRLFTVLYFSVTSTRSSALRYGLLSCVSVKTTAINPDARPLGTFENQDGRH